MEIRALSPTDGSNGDRFGLSVASNGSQLIVGAPSHSSTGLYSGAAYIFDMSTGTQLHKLVPSDNHTADYFGSAVALFGTTAVITAPFDDDNGVDSGSVYLFDVTLGTQIAKVLPSDGEGGDYFGLSLATDGTNFLVGAPFDRINGVATGSAYLFDCLSGTQIRKLKAPDGAGGDEFGSSAAIAGGTAVIGAPHSEPGGVGHGAAYLLDVPSGAQRFKLTPSDGVSGDLFGIAVSISEDTVVVGSIVNVEAGAYPPAKAHVFDAVTGIELSMLQSSPSAPDETFGTSVTIQGSQVLVGAPVDWNGGGYGRAHLFDVSSLALGTNYCSATVNSTGHGAGMIASCSTSIAENSFTLTAGPVPNTPYVFFHAQNQAQIPFGDGTLCTTGNLLRLGPPQVAIGQVAQRTVDLPVEIAGPGTRHFQCWFRDPAAAGAGFNLSDGLTITFQP